MRLARIATLIGGLTIALALPGTVHAVGKIVVSELATANAGTAFGDEFVE